MPSHFSRFSSPSGNPVIVDPQTKISIVSALTIAVTGPLGALVFDDRPEVYCKESLELLFQSIDCLEHLLHSFYNSCHSSVTQS